MCFAHVFGDPFGRPFGPLMEMFSPSRRPALVPIFHASARSDGSFTLDDRNVLGQIISLICMICMTCVICMIFYDLNDLYDLYDMYDLAHVVGWVP